MRHDELFFKKLGRLRNLLWILVGLLPLCTSCKDSESKEGTFDPNAPVEVTNIVPETGIISLPLVISGKNFGDDKSRIKVFFDDVQAVIISVKNDHLYVLNPRQDDGNHTVKVVVDGKEGVLEKKFNYVVTSSVTTVAGSLYNEDTGNTPLQIAVKSPNYIAVDNKHNLVVYCRNASGDKQLKLISLEDNKVTVLSEEGDISGLCFSSDYSRLYSGKDSKNLLATEWDCNGNWASTNMTAPDISETVMVVADRANNLYFTGYKGEIIKKDHKTGNVSIIGKVPDKYFSTNSNGYLYAAYNPKDNYMYISSPKRGVIFRIDLSKDNFNNENDFELYTGILNQSGFNNGPREEALFGEPKGLAFDSKGNMYVADNLNNLIRKITPAGIVSTLTGQYKGTGGGEPGPKDGSLEEALFFHPFAIAIDPNDIIYVADRDNSKIRCISVQ